MLDYSKQTNDSNLFLKISLQILNNTYMDMDININIAYEAF